ncbi:MAG TPA: septum site-determining protein MinC [Tissierellaceae bacterium]
MKKDVISFKGVGDGVYIIVNTDDFSIAKEELDNKLKSASIFFKGTKILGIKSDMLPYENILELKYFLKYKYDLIVSDEDMPVIKNNFKNVMNNTDDIECGITKFINGTLRSGQIIEFDGNIVVIGDVNPGAFVKAKGNIIVLGALRGVAHAGMDGNLNAIVASYHLQPTQLRIGDIIARPPDDDVDTLKMPEVARIKDGEVIIEPYLPNK